MEITRRAFGKMSGSLLAFVALAGGFLTACSQTIFQTILNYIGVGLQAFQAVVNLLAGQGVINLGTGTVIDMAINLVKAGFADLQVAIQNYDNAPAANKTTLLEKISTIITTIENSLSQFWSDLKIPDANLASTIEGLLEIILSTLAGFQTQLPVSAAKASAVRLGPRAVAPVKRTVKQFKSDFNAVLVKHNYPKYAI